MHPTFIVLLRKPFMGNILLSDSKQVIRPPLDLLGGHLEYEVDVILDVEIKNKNEVNT